MENEEWRDVPGYEGCYQVSSFGRVKSVRNKKNSRAGMVLVPLNNSKGYWSINLWKDGHCKMSTIHKLVAQAFIPNPENKPCVDHKDGNRKNNNVANLRWCTYKENSNFPLAKKHYSERMSIHRKGIEHHCSTPIICVELNTLFWGGGDAARKLGIGQGHILNAAKGKAKSAGGYHWRCATKEEIEYAMQTF